MEQNVNPSVGFISYLGVCVKVVLDQMLNKRTVKVSWFMEMPGGKEKVHFGETKASVTDLLG